MADTSTLSKVNKSPAWKAAKRERHDANVAMRAALHQEKAASGDAGKRAIVQGKIDEMSKRGSQKGGC